MTTIKVPCAAKPGIILTLIASYGLVLSGCGGSSGAAGSGGTTGADTGGSSDASSGGHATTAGGSTSAVSGGGSNAGAGGSSRTGTGGSSTAGASGSSSTGTSGAPGAAGCGPGLFSAQQIACAYPTGLCTEGTIVTTSVSGYSQGCMQQSGTLGTSCPTANLLGCCAKPCVGGGIEGVSTTCFYPAAGTLAAVQAFCTQEGGAWSTTP